jgi:hypothetical protein
MRPGRDTAIHFTPLFRYFIGAEIFVAIVARARGYRLTVDVRAGSQENDYLAGSSVYQWLFRKMLSLASEVTYEGQAYRAFIQKISPQTLARLLPNFVPSSELDWRAPVPPDSAPRLIYVGTLSNDDVRWCDGARLR